MEHWSNYKFSKVVGTPRVRPAIVAGIALILLLASCDSNSPSVIEPDIEIPTRTLTTSTEEITLSNGEVSIDLKTNSGQYGGRWRFDPHDRNRYFELIGRAGLLLATTDGIAKANAVGPASFQNLFKFSSDTTYSPGFFVVTRDSLLERIDNWPSELGAPSDIDGQPKMLGDVMSWASFDPYPFSTSTEPYVENVRIDITTFLSEEFRMTNMVFVRTGLTNVSDIPISNVYAGYGGDTDVGTFYTSVPDECTIEHAFNQVGYDHDRLLSFVYNSPGIPYYDNQPEHCLGFIAGFSVLASTNPDDIGSTVLSHRIMRRWATEAYPDFGGESFKTSEAVLNALKGLSNSGSPMIDPTTSEQSYFSFTGDPVSKTGWIDERHDNRHMLSFEPFNLNPGERKYFTVVWLFADGENQANGLSRLKAYRDVAASRPDVWD